MKRLALILMLVGGVGCASPTKPSPPTVDGTWEGTARVGAIGQFPTQVTHTATFTFTPSSGGFSGTWTLTPIGPGDSMSGTLSGYITPAIGLGYLDTVDLFLMSTCGTDTQARAKGATPMYAASFFGFAAYEGFKSSAAVCRTGHVEVALKTYRPAR